LKSYNPDVIVTAGMFPTMLIAWLYRMFYKKKHFVATDAWSLTEKNLKAPNKILRKILYAKADAFLPVSDKGIDNFKSNYKIPDNKIFKCGYIVDNNKYSALINTEKKYDIMFAGQFIERKLPFFFCDIAIELKKEKKDIKVLIIGSGPLEKEILDKLRKNEIDFDYPGFILQKDIPMYYAMSRIFLFTTQEDAWGVVANEACATGIPIITTPYAGCANELIIDNFNGYILKPEVKLWTSKILELLNNKTLYTQFSTNALEHIKNFTVKNALNNFINAINSLNIS
jgi:glycosyltransferase involved in cell wall biosynthesis